MNLEVLRSDLVDDPLGMGYAAMSDEEAAESLNSTIQEVRRVPIPDLMGLAYDIGLYVRLLAAQHGAETPADLWAVVTALLDLKASQLTVIDILAPDGTPFPSTAAMLDVLQQASLLSDDERAAIEALALQPTTRAAQLGIPPVGPHHVAVARG